MATTQIDFKVKNGLIVVTTATIQSTLPTSSTATGALTIAGGLGVGGGGYFGGIVTATNFILNGYQVSTSTSGGAGAVSVSVQSTTTNASFYPVFVSQNASTSTALPEYTTSSFSINPSTGVVNINSLVGSLTTNSGALQVSGGVGVAGTMTIGGSVVMTTGSGVNARMIFNSALTSIDFLFY